MIEPRQDRTTDARPEAVNPERSGFLKGIIGGAVIGAVAGVLMAPQIYPALRRLRRDLTDAMADAHDGAADRYQAATERVGEAVDDLQEKGRKGAGKALNVVIRGAEGVKARATESQNELDRRAVPPAQL